MTDGPYYDALSGDDLIEIADAVLSGGIVVRDPGLLVSALDRPWLSVLGRDAYSDVEDRAAALMQSLARNGPLIDGNQALAWAATRVFLLLNGWDLVCETDEAVRMLRGAAGGQLDTPALVDALRSRIR